MNRIDDSVLRAQAEKERRRVEDYSEQLKVCTDVNQAKTLNALIGGASSRLARARRLLQARTAREQAKAAERLSERV